MISLQVLSGKKAGSQTEARHFPFHIGRAPQNQLALEDDGVWDRHLTLEFHPTEGFELIAAHDAITAVNGRPVEKTILHNGDIITVGSAKVQFWLAPARQRSLALRENLIWGLLILVTVAQFVLLCTLLH